MHHFSLFVSISMASYTDQQVPFRCCHCEYVGRCRDALRHHISTTHLDTYILSSERGQVTLTREHGVFRCGICHASTTSTRNLSRHARCYFPVETVGQGTSSVHVDDAPDCSGISDGSVPSSAVRFPPSFESSVAVPTVVLNSSNRLPAIAWISDSEVIIRGISVSLDQIRGAYQEALSKCRAFIETLLLGMSHSFAPSVYDNFSNMTLGFQMMADKNPCFDEQIRSSLLTHILTNEQLRRRFISSRSEDNKVVYCANEAMNYIAIYDDYMSHMVVLIHIGSGMPARATEMETFRIRNGPSTCRNVFYHCGQVFFFSEYSKSRSITRVNSGISRFMDEEATIILLKDLLLIRPLVCSMASFLGLNEGQVYNNDLFVINGQILKAPGLRNNFCRLFDKLTGGCVITFRDYRQVAKYFANIMLGTVSPATNDDSESDDGDEFSYVHSAIAHQFGCSGEMPRLRDHLLHQFKHLSGEWHTLLNGPKRNNTQQDVHSCS